LREKKWVIGIILVTAFSLLGFIVEAVVLGFIPFFLVDMTKGACEQAPPEF